MNHPGNDGGQRHNESYGHAHAKGGIDFLGHAQERTNAQELVHNKVVDQNCADQDHQVIHAISSFRAALRLE